MKTPKYISQHLVKNMSDEELSKLGDDEIEFWTHRTCGIACVSMILNSSLREAPSFYELLKKAIYNDGYTSKGWKHASLASLLKEHGIRHAVSKGMDRYDIEKGLKKGFVYVVSVTHMFPENGKTGGHLVLLYYMDDSTVYFNDPSTWGEEHHRLEKKRFFSSYSNRCIEVFS